MRLKPEEAKIIKDAVHMLDPEARIFLFGSRVDETKKGGDIDLLVLSNTLKNINSIDIIKKIYEKIEEQKIDILISADTSDLFVQTAIETGVEL